MARFHYIDRPDTATGPMPLLRISLSYCGRSLAVTGLVDSGASISVLPHYVGLALGAIWDEALRPFPLTGSFGTTDALGLRVMARHPQLATDNPIELLLRGLVLTLFRSCLDR